jgi:hypothetical protein
MEALKRRSEQHRRSLQQELMTILERAAQEPIGPDPGQAAAAIRERLAQTGRQFSDSTELVREDRDR